MQSLRVVLLHKGKVVPSIRVAYTILKKGNVSGALKVTAILMGLQNYVVSYVNGIVMPNVFTTARRSGFYIHHIHLEQKT